MSSVSEVFISLSNTNALVKPLSKQAVRSNTARLRSTVMYEELPTGTRRRVTLVNPRDADAGAGRISVLSPIGRALLGHKTGQVIDVVLPMDRRLSVRVLEVSAHQTEHVDQPAYA